MYRVVDGLLDLTRDEPAAVLGHIANKGNISTAAFLMDVTGKNNQASNLDTRVECLVH